MISLLNAGGSFMKYANAAKIIHHHRPALEMNGKGKD